LLNIPLPRITVSFEFHYQHSPRDKKDNINPALTERHHVLKDSTIFPRSGSHIQYFPRLDLDEGYRTVPSADLLWRGIPHKGHKRVDYLTERRSFEHWKVPGPTKSFTLNR
jgi:hypothetical protein